MKLTATPRTRRDDGQAALKKERSVKFKTIAIAVFLVCFASAQQIIPVNQQQGITTPPLGNCAYLAQVGNMWNQIGNSSNVSYICEQTGTAANGAQPTFGWVPIQLQPVGSGTTGTISVANGKAATISNSLTIAGTDGTISTLPAVSSGITAAYFCGTTTGNAACSNTATGGTARVIGGIATLASNTAVISGISPAFTSTSSYACVANDLTTRANPVQVENTSTSSITITNTTGASDVINWICVGF